ncbi:MAG TPA: hypothetical protein VFS08_00265, partial [Gemmatimonadaceae bacterium]|nr:hypothetical protein [Gemmatimonadaceae bacterium]
MSAQMLPPKSAPANDGTPQSCAAPPQRAAPSAANRAKAQRLATAGMEAAISGDQRTARDRLAEAAALDPTDADIAYQLGRAQEALGAQGDALREYCRYLALSPDGGDAADVSERVARLSPRPARVIPDAAMVHFRAGVSAQSARRWSDAEREFTRAIAVARDWGAPYYNRALVREAQKRPEQAIGDLQRYLELEPEARDRPAVVRHVAELRKRTLDSGEALALGLMPGVGQMYTRRPGLGVLFLAGAGGAAYWGLRQDSRMVTRTETFVDPFGKEYTETITEEVRSRPNLTAGVATAAGITLLGAIEAWRYAKRASRPMRVGEARDDRVSAPWLLAGGDAVGVGLT